MDRFYEVVCRRTQRSIFRDQGETEIDVGDRVVVDIDGRKDIGEVVWKGEGELPIDVDLEIAWVVRRATADDSRIFEERREKELAALEVFTQKIGEHGLPMKPVDVEYEDDTSRITFYFTADNRVDFRALVRDLAHIYHTRIELRQISPRIEIQRQGGFGTCGRPLCCASFMKKMPAVPAHAARDQSLSQNLSKLAGVCGQLKCCLRFELDFYKEAKDRFPRVGSSVSVGEGESGNVKRTNIFEGTVQIEREDGQVQDLSLSEMGKAGEDRGNEERGRTS